MAAFIEVGTLLHKQSFQMKNNNEQAVFSI